MCNDANWFAGSENGHMHIVALVFIDRQGQSFNISELGSILDINVLPYPSIIVFTWAIGLYNSVSGQVRSGQSV